MEKRWYVYIVGNNRPTLYIGVTNNLIKRVYQHKHGVVEGFTKRYILEKLLYYEVFNSPENAIYREKQLKHWNRKWKLNLIRENNPSMQDLWLKIILSV